MNQDFVCRKQLSLLQKRIRKAEETDASNEVYEFLWKLFKAKNYDAMKIMVVGAGGSYPAAISASHSLRKEMKTPYVEAVTPQTALRILSQTDTIFNAEHKPEYDAIIGISYSGKTPDIKAVYEDCVKRGFPFVLFTGANKETLREEYKFAKIASYFNREDTTGKEIGMISMFSTLIPAILFEDYVVSSNPKDCWYKIYERDLEEGKEFISQLDISKIAKVLNRRPVIHVIYEWRTHAIAEDIASKFMESGIASVVLHEKKNFSHGCYTLLYKQRFGMVINLTKFNVAFDMPHGNVKLTYDNIYDEELNEFLKEICKRKFAIYLELGNGQVETSQMLIKEMCKLPYLITAVGEEMGIDISKPFDPDPFPQETKSLYRYKGDF